MFGKQLHVHPIHPQRITRDNYIMNSNDRNTPKLYNPKANAPAVYIPAWLSQVPSKLLTSTSKMVYGRLAQWSTSSGKAHRSAKQLSEELGIPSRTVENCLKELREKKLIGSYVPRDGGHNHFEFYDHEWMYEEINKHLCYQSGFESPSAKSAVPSAKSAVHKIKEIKEIKTTTTETPKTKQKTEPAQKQSSSSFESQVLELKPESDTRSDEVFLQHVNDHIQRNSDKALNNIYKKRKGVLSILKNLLANNEIFYSDGFIDHETKKQKELAEKKREQEFLDAQERQWKKRMESYGSAQQHA